MVVGSSPTVGVVNFLATVLISETVKLLVFSFAIYRLQNSMKKKSTVLWIPVWSPTTVLAEPVPA